MGLRKSLRKAGKGKKARVPIFAAAMDILKHTGATEGITLMKHIRLVRSGALKLAMAAKAKGLKVDVGLVHSSAVLHDLAMPCNDIERERLKRASPIALKIARKAQIKEGRAISHERAAAQLLYRKGYPEIGRAISRHGDIPAEIAERHFPFEDRLLSLVDSRQLGEGFVTLDKKLSYLLERYSKPENMPPRFRTQQEYASSITAKYESLKRFEQTLIGKGIDVDAILKDAVQPKPK